MSSENILLLGLGGVGYHLAQRLAREGHQLTVIEADPVQLKRADAEIDARLIRGDAMSFACWERAEASKMDTVIAVTDNDAVNILAAIIADRCGVRQKIARVRSLELWSETAQLSPEALNIDLVIRPAELAAREIERLLTIRAGTVTVDVGEGYLQVVATHVGRHSPISRMTVRDLAEKHDDLDFRVVAVARDIATIVPGGDFKIRPGDHVYVLARTEVMPRLLPLLEVSQQSTRHRVMIVGGGLVGARIAELLQDRFPTRLIEQDADRAEALTHELRRTEVLHGDGSSQDTLMQAGLMQMDTVVTATGENETNILTSVLAKYLFRQRGGGEDAKTIALVRREEYLTLASAMGLDLAVNKKVLAGNEILRWLRRGQVLSVAHLHGCDAEVVELVAEPNAPITRRCLENLTLESILIGGFCRSGVWQIARGATRIQAGDRVAAVCASNRLPELEGLFLS